MMKILLIGSRGFVGRYLKTIIEKIPNVQLFEGYQYNIDILNRESLESAFKTIQPNVIINLAAFSDLHDPSAVKIYEMNLMGIINLLEVCEQNNCVKRFVFASSAYIYGMKTPGLVEEDRRPYPVHDYAIAKLAAEQACLLRAAKFEIAIGRIFNSFGVGHKPFYLVPKLVKAFVEKQEEIKIGRTDVVRDFIDVRDVAAGFATIATEPLKNSVFNICSAQPTPLQSIIDTLIKITGHTPVMTVDPSFIRAQDNLHLVGGNERLKQTGWQRKYTLDDTLIWMVQEQINANK